MSDLFWKRWVKEYLPQLQERQKWQRIGRNFIPGDVVIVVNNSAPRNSWGLMSVQGKAVDPGSIRPVKEPVFTETNKMIYVGFSEFFFNGVAMAIYNSRPFEFNVPEDRGSRPGPTQYAISRVDDLKSSFQLFLPESIEGIILEMTNLEGKRVFGDTWREIDLVDLQAYKGLLILAGVYRSNNEATKSLWDAESGRPIFRATMSLEQFRVLSRIIRFDNRETRQNDKLAAIRNIWDRWVERLPLMYNPGPEVTVDECLVPFRGRCPFKVYLSSNPGKCGIKVWVACDASSSYAWNMQVYTGKPSSGGADKNQGVRVVLDKTTSLQGHNTTCDNKPELSPAQVSTRGREAVSNVPTENRNVIPMSTLHKDAAVSTTEDRKPLIIQDYKKNKGGVDCLDKLTGTYTCKLMTARWPVALFHKILDVSAFNAYVVWTAIDPTWNQGKSFRKRLFLAELGKALATPLIQRRQHIPRTPASASLVKSVQAPAPATGLAALPQQRHGQKRKR
ncbi:uncharacterized protein LOC102793740, partial [Neolamprologus brichardi]|uniref:uncharacterized protein LOC102793740 n=1 Tax=Neolamprologus brichardi TaxID=32507 RepID=UPI0016436D60